MAVRGLAGVGLAVVPRPARPAREPPRCRRSLSTRTRGWNRTSTLRTRTIQANPKDPEAYNVRGTADGRAGQYDRAIKDFTTAIQLDPNFYQAYANRGLVLRQTNRPADAIADYNRALQINPNYDFVDIGSCITHRVAGSQPRGARRLPAGDRPRHHRSACLPQSRAALSEGRPAQAGDRGLFARDLAGCAGARALFRPRRLLPGARRRGERLRRLQHRAAPRRLQGRVLDQPGACLREARRQAEGVPVLLQGGPARPSLPAGQGRPRPGAHLRLTGAAGTGATRPCSPPPRPRPRLLTKPFVHHVCQSVRNCNGTCRSRRFSAAKDNQTDR